MKADLDFDAALYRRLKGRANGPHGAYHEVEWTALISRAKTRESTAPAGSICRAVR